MRSGSRSFGGGGSGGGGGYRGAWDVGTAYAAGDIVRHGNASYGASGASTGTSPVTVTNGLSGTPGNTAAVDGSDYELGTRFSVSRDVRLTALCFWKSSLETQVPHTLKLWDIGVSTTSPIATATHVGETGAGTGVHVAPMSVDLKAGRTYYATKATGTGTDTGYATTAGVSLPITAGSVTIDAFLFSGTIGNVTTVTTGTTSYWVWPRWEEPGAGWDLVSRFDRVAVGADRDLYVPVAP